MKYAGRLRKTLMGSISHICTERDKYFVSPDKDFTRPGKFTAQDLFRCILTMEGTALSHELLNYFDFNVNAPTTSAFVQARAKIKPQAFEDLFYNFSSLSCDNKLFKGYRLLACDGSDIHIPTNPEDKASFHSNTNGGKPYNLLHLNALYDLMTHTYTDAVIQKSFDWNEHSAFVEMTKHHSDDTAPAIFIADRGYESYNNMAHITESGNRFLIRLRDSKTSGIISGLDLPDGEYDTSIVFKLVRKQSNEIKAMMRKDKFLKFVSSTSTFDFLPAKSKKTDPAVMYELPVRLVRFKITNETYEVIATNLPENEFSPAELKQLYAFRWGIETSFRDLKYTVGLLHFHAKKTESILQEIWARLIMYNFSELVASHTTIKKSNRKHLYRINFSNTVHICRNFLLRRIPPSDVEALVAANILPIRSGKSHPRVHSVKHAAYFIYRVA